MIIASTSFTRRVLLPSQTRTPLMVTPVHPLIPADCPRAQGAAHRQRAPPGLETLKPPTQRKLRPKGESGGPVEHRIDPKTRLLMPSDL